MATYTGIADENGDFAIPFSSNYTSGQKVTVTAEKDGAEKKIEMFAPSDLFGGGIIQFTGTMHDFPNNIGGVVLTDQIGVSIGDNAFYAANNNMWSKATGLTIANTVQTIGSNAFYNWAAVTALTIPNSVTSIDYSAFEGLTSVTSLTIGSSIQNIGSYGFLGLANCDEIKVLATTPPTITSDTFLNRKTSCVFRVPAASLATYKAAPIWKTFASRIYAIA